MISRMPSWNSSSRLRSRSISVWIRAASPSSHARRSSARRRASERMASASRAADVRSSSASLWAATNASRSSRSGPCTAASSSRSFSTRPRSSATSWSVRSRSRAISRSSVSTTRVAQPRNTLGSEPSSASTGECTAQPAGLLEPLARARTIPDTFRQRHRSPAWTDAVKEALATLVGAPNVLPGTEAAYLQDATATRGLHGRADSIVLPGTAEEVASVVAWCYEHDVPMVPRGRRYGLRGRSGPDRRRRRHLARAAHAGSLVRSAALADRSRGRRATGDIQRLARENGLFFPPDPGAAEQSQIGGNIATNAGGPHAFKYGVTGAWVTGLQAVIPPGDVVSVGGAIRKESAGYDLKNLLIGSEGTLGIITAAWLRLHPGPRGRLAARRVLRRRAAGCEAIERVDRQRPRRRPRSSISTPATLAIAGARLPGPRPETARFMVLVEADGRRRRRRLSATSSRRCSARTRSTCSRPRRRRQSPTSGAGATASRSRSRRGAAARSARTSSSRSTGSPRRSRRWSRSGAATSSRPAAGDMRATATCTRLLLVDLTRRGRARDARSGPARSCSSSAQGSAARSPASTDSAG